ncbi:hypothetical protein MC885_019126, partial [Smutsia gigantea]
MEDFKLSTKPKSPSTFSHMPSHEIINITERPGQKKAELCTLTGLEKRQYVEHVLPKYSDFPFSSEILGSLTNSQLLQSSLTEILPADSTLPTLFTPPLRLWTELHHRLLCRVNAPLDSRSASAVHDAQEVNNECLLNEGSIRFPISAVCEVKRAITGILAFARETTIPRPIVLRPRTPAEEMGCADAVFQDAPEG